MAKLESIENVGVFVKDLKKAKQFYTKKVGLAVREEDRKFGYLALGATKGGGDADLNVWQPVPSWGSEWYESGRKQIGGVTGIGFRTSNLKGTLEAFLRRRGRLLTRDFLIEEIWGADYFGDTRTLDVHVKRLRRKLEQDPHHPQHLLTVRGLGYKFVD